MNINSLPRATPASATPGVLQDDPLNPLVFTSINDVPENPRLGLGYHQLYDPTVPVGLIARLPQKCREGDVLTLFWDTVQVQQYDRQGLAQLQRFAHPNQRHQQRGHGVLHPL